MEVDSWMSWNEWQNNQTSRKRGKATSLYQWSHVFHQNSYGWQFLYESVRSMEGLQVWNLAACWQYLEYSIRCPTWKKICLVRMTLKLLRLLVYDNFNHENGWRAHRFGVFGFQGYIKKVQALEVLNDGVWHVEESIQFKWPEKSSNLLVFVICVLFWLIWR